jgi:hypothetical protein
MWRRKLLAWFSHRAAGISFFGECSMKTKLLGLVAACALLGSTVAANASPYVVTLEEVGANVVATGSGDIVTTGLVSPGVANVVPQLIPEVGAVYTGLPSSTPQAEFYAAALSGPASFGPGSQTFAATGTGAMVALFYAVSEIAVPIGYSSDTLLSDTAIYDTATFASLGVTPGTYVWTWGTGADQSFTLEIGTTPLPAALPLFATGLGALGLLGWRRKRKAAIAAA